MHFQVVMVDMEENRTELQRIFNLSNSIMRMGSICAEGSKLTLTTKSLPWETFSSKADQMFGCEHDPRQEWWFDHKEAISDIASAVLIYYQELGKFSHDLIDSTSSSSVDILESKSVVKDNGDFVMLELTVSEFPKCQSLRIQKKRGGNRYNQPNKSPRLWNCEESVYYV